MYAASEGTNAPKHLATTPVISLTTSQKRTRAQRATAGIRRMIAASAMAAAAITTLSAQSPDAGHPECTVAEVSRRPLIVEGGRSLYVDAQTIAPSRSGEVLLAGHRTVLFSDNAGERAVVDGVDAVMGAVVRPDGMAHTIPLPLPERRIANISARERVDGGWDVVFAELRGDPRDPPELERDTVARLWHGVYDGRRWRTIEQIPPWPDTLNLAPRGAPLVAFDGRLAWALPFSTTHNLHGVAVFERRDGRWRLETLGTTMVAYISLAYSGEGILQAAVVAPDTSLPKPATDVNSLFLWERRLAWRRSMRLVQGGREGATYEPTLNSPGDGSTVLTWVAEPDGERRAHAMVDPFGANPAPPLVVDSRVSFWGYAIPLVTGADRHLWVTDHQLSDSRQSHIQFHGIENGAPSLVGEMPSPFLGGFRAAPVGKSDVLLSGTEVLPGEKAMVTILVRVRVKCTSEGN